MPMRLTMGVDSRTAQNCGLNAHIALTFGETKISSFLKALPDSGLLLKASSFSDSGAAVRERKHKLDVDIARLVCRGPTGLTEMMAECAEVDIAL